MALFLLYLSRKHLTSAYCLLVRCYVSYDVVCFPRTYLFILGFKRPKPLYSFMVDTFLLYIENTQTYPNRHAQYTKYLYVERLNTRHFNAQEVFLPYGRNTQMNLYFIIKTALDKYDCKCSLSGRMYVFAKKHKTLKSNGSVLALNLLLTLLLLYPKWGNILKNKNKRTVV